MKELEVNQKIEVIVQKLVIMNLIKHHFKKIYPSKYLLNIILLRINSIYYRNNWIMKNKEQIN